MSCTVAQPRTHERNILSFDRQKGKTPKSDIDYKNDGNIYHATMHIRALTRESNKQQARRRQ